MLAAAPGDPEVDYLDDEHLRAHLRRCGVPARLLAAAVAPKPSPAIAALERWLAGVPGGPVTFLVLLGPPGTGKTVAACRALRRAVHRMRWQECTGVDDGRLHERTVYDNSRCLLLTGVGLASLGFEDQDKRTLARAGRVELLVLDDLGVERSSPLVQERLDWLINERWAENRWTVITSNLQAQALSRPPAEGGYGRRIADRIKGSGLVVQLHGRSMRWAP